MQKIIDCLRKFITSDVFYIDCGANVGDIAIPVMQMKPRYSFLIEPDKEALVQLKESLSFIQTRRYKIIEKALSDRVGETDFYHVKNAPSRSTFYGKRFQESEVEKVRVPTTTIDSLVEELEIDKLDFVMKMDCELAEPLIWRGMKKTIRRIKVIVMEFQPRILTFDAQHNSERFLDEIRMAGYSITNLDGTMPSLRDLTDPVGSKIDLLLRRL